MPHSTAPVHENRIDSVPDGFKVFTPRSPIEVTPMAQRPCEICACPLTYVATMRGIGLRPKVTVYRCNHCKRIVTEEE
jgi:hypothetical protein